MSKRSNLSKEEREEILSKPFQLWPNPAPGEKYGPSEKQAKLFIADMPEHKRPHLHPKDITLFIGGSQCLGFNTPILMFDGTIKMVQDVQVGDLLMGPDSQPRRVESLARGREEMFKVIPVKGEPWICNRSHTLSLKEYTLRTRSTANITVDDYLKLAKSMQTNYKLYRLNPDNKERKYQESAFSLESQGEGNYYGFEISGPDRLFLLGDFTVTHNSGKTLAALVLAVKACLENQNILVIYGAKTYKDLNDIVISKMKEMFTIKDPWDSPLIRNIPNEHNKILEFHTNSRIMFLHLDEVLRLRGRTADMLIIEECTQLQDAKSFEEASRRLSSIKLPVLQMVLLTNNPESRNWVYDKFALKQFSPAYKKSSLPPIPIGPECNCHLCQSCLFPSQDRLDRGVKPKEVEYIDHICPECDEVQKPYIIQGKTTYCPGRQHYWRVIKISSQDNKHVASTYVQDNLGTMDSETGALYIMGEFLELRKGFVYWAFTDENILPDNNKKLDYKKDIVWSLDFNTSFQCSVLCQEEGEKGKELVYVIDELIIPDTKPNGGEYIVSGFIEKLKNSFSYDEYEEFKKTKKVIVYGDPNGWNRNQGSSQATYYQLIIEGLNKEKLNYQFKVRRKGKILPVTTKVNNLNTFLRNRSGLKRVYVNPHCSYLIAGLDGVRFKPDGKTINDIPDKKAAEETDKSIVFSLTHPTDALAYYIAKRFPILDDGEILNPFIQTPGEDLVELTEEGIKETVYKKEEDPKPAEESLMDLINFYRSDFQGTPDLFYW